MRCKNCNIEIDFQTKICPLCHERIIERDDLPAAFPQKTKQSYSHKHFTLTSIYTFVALLIFLACITVNYLTSKEILWCYIVGLALGYGLFLIRHTVLANHSISIKILAQFFVITLVLYLTGLILKNASWVTDYALPAILMIAIIVQSVFVMVMAKKDRSQIISAIIISVLGYLPIILWAMKISNFIWTALACALVGTVSLIGTIIFGATDIGEEFTKRFHF